MLAQLMLRLLGCPIEASDHMTLYSLYHYKGKLIGQLLHIRCIIWPVVHFRIIYRLYYKGTLSDSPDLNRARNGDKRSRSKDHREGKER